MATIRIPTPLRKLTQGKEEVTATGGTIGALIASLETQYPGIKERICDDSGQVRRFVNIFANDEDIRFLKNLETLGQGQRRDLDRPGHRGRRALVRSRTVAWTSPTSQRYARQIALPEVGPEGQIADLRRARAGDRRRAAAAETAATYLRAAGVGQVIAREDSPADGDAWLAALAERRPRRARRLR